VADPTVTPVILPVKEPIVAIDGLLLTHVPPPIEPDIPIGNPTQIFEGPIIEGSGLMVRGAVMKHPVGNV
jgi:hypothetical protein